MAGLHSVGRDPVGQAIAAAETGEKVTRVEMTQVNVKLATGRPAVIAVPVDATDFELLNLVGAVLQVGDQLRAQRPASRIALPHGVRR